MHGRGCEERKRIRHMRKASTRCNLIVTAAANGSSSSSANSFCKDGRKINVGDCALFKPPQDCPPFIGIIRWLTIGKENKLKLGVNWLYRPAEVKLGKGVLLESATNEIFYSFHKDEIPAASLLHPCKVAFLPKGVELPAGVSYFVCRRVYDITNKCLWWLTDKDYIDERQTEVDKLLYKTRIEMHATVPPGGRSPKPMNSPTSTSQFKSGADSVQNSASSFPSQVKGKKRERLDQQASEPLKRERIAKTDDGDSVHSRLESTLKTEIAKITEKGGLVNSEGVERLVQLMIPDRNERKIDLASRSVLAGVIAATDKFDLLSLFVQLKGLPVFDEWLQEVHKGKIGDNSGSRDGDKSVEDFLFVLLRALDKLPINLQALQMCNIGKSVNHLRSHKNLEIQRKARGLVDTWKKRVEAEMNINDARSGSTQAEALPARPCLAETAQGGNRHSGGSSDVAIRSSVTQISASKGTSVKVAPGESTIRSASASPGSVKSVPSPVSITMNLKEGQSRGSGVVVASEPPLVLGRDDKSCSSGQSHNNVQSCSSEHAKTGGIVVKEDPRSSTAGSINANKISGSSSRHRKSINGFPGSSPSASQRETGITRSSSWHKSTTSEKVSQSGLACEKAFDGPVVEGNSHKLIVKIPSRGRSPAQSACGGSFDDPSIMNSRASSPVLLEKHDTCDRSLKEKSDSCRANVTSEINTESWQSNDFKDVLTGSDEGDESPAAVTGEEQCKTSDESKKLLEVSKPASSSSGNEIKSGNLHDASFSSINALIESCVKYSEANASMSVADVVGMNLLASVAAGEISKSDLVTPTGSPQRNILIVEQSCFGNGAKVKSPDEDQVLDKSHSGDAAVDMHEKHGLVSGDLGANYGDSDSASVESEGRPTGEHSKRVLSSSLDLQPTSSACLESEEKTNKKPASATSLALSESNVERALDSEGVKPEKETKVVLGVNTGDNDNPKQNLYGPLPAEDIVNDIPSKEVEVDSIDKLSSHPSAEVNGKEKAGMTEAPNCGGQTAQKASTMLQYDSVKETDKNVLHSSGYGMDMDMENVDGKKGEKVDQVDAHICVNQPQKQKNEFDISSGTIPENRAHVGSGSGVTTDHGVEHVEENSELKELNEPRGELIPRKVLPSQEAEQCPGSKRLKLGGSDAEDAEECTSTNADVSSMSAAGVSEADAKVEFDLNQGFSADDGKSGELNNIAAPGCSATVRLISPVPFPASASSGGIHASITVAAAAKGPFVPPKDLLKTKIELGWKGSAATSAFRPAEPRKVVEMPVSIAAKQNRPPLDIDLNVPDQRVLEDIASQTGSCATETMILSNNVNESSEKVLASASGRSSGGLDLDLNQVDEVSDIGNCSTSNSHRMDVPLLSVKASTGGPSNSDVGLCRDFDLNNGPAVEEPSAEPSFFNPYSRISMPSQLPVSGLRMSAAEVGNFSSWFPSSGNTYSAVTISSIMPDRGDQPFSIVGSSAPQRVLGPSTGASPFGPDVYRGPVLSSLPAVPFPSVPYHYPVFPFGSNFPVSSTSFSGGSATYVDSASGPRLCFPAVNSQTLGSASNVSSHYPRPHVVSLSNGSNSADSSRKWVRHALDLNAGPGGPETEGRDDIAYLRQLSVASSQTIAEEQARMLQVPASILKRKEPEGGWDSYKHSS